MKFIKMISGVSNGKKIAICAVLVIICLYPVGGLVLDLSHTSFPSCIDVFEGTFSGGGIYRMFHSTECQIDVIKNGGQILTPLARIPTPPIDVYVQEYSREEGKFLTVSQFYDTTGKALITRTYETAGARYRIINKKAKQKFIGGPIFIRLDLNGGKIHPFIVPLTLTEMDKRLLSYSVAPYDPVKASAINHVRSRDEIVLISPIINIDDTPSDLNITPSSINSHSIKVNIAPGKEFLMLWIKHGSFVTKITLSLPPTEEGIFKPRNILHHPFNYHTTQSGTIIKCISINVDISSIQSAQPSVVILANLERGDWIYTQYSIAPIVDLSRIFLKVINSKEKCEIYQVTDDAIVTHVELFTHVKHGWQYVVINVKQWVKTHIKDARIVYKRIDGEKKLTYFNLNNFWVQPYIDMLYNINATAKNNRT